MATHSSLLAWEIQRKWTEEAGKSQSQLGDNDMARQRPRPHGAEQTTGKHLNRQDPQWPGREAGQIRVRNTGISACLSIGTADVTQEYYTHALLCF